MELNLGVIYNMIKNDFPNLDDREVHVVSEHVYIKLNKYKSTNDFGFTNDYTSVVKEILFENVENISAVNSIMNDDIDILI